MKSDSPKLLELTFFEASFCKQYLTMAIVYNGTIKDNGGDGWPFLILTQLSQVHYDVTHCIKRTSLDPSYCLPQEDIT